MLRIHRRNSNAYRGIYEFLQQNTPANFGRYIYEDFGRNQLFRFQKIFESIDEQIPFPFCAFTVSSVSLHHTIATHSNTTFAGVCKILAKK